MLLDYDQDLEKLVEFYTPRWTEDPLRKIDFSKIDENSYASIDVWFVGTPSLVCCTTAKDVPDMNMNWEYYPILLKVVENITYNSSKWITLLRVGGSSPLEQKNQWLFETPSMRLLVGEDESTEFMEPDSPRHFIKYYDGVELTDPGGKKKLQIRATEAPDFMVDLRFVG